MTTELTIQDANDGFMIVNTLEQALKISEIIAKSSFCPKEYKDKPGDVLVCLQFAKEVGLKPLQGLQNIAVINGKPAIYGDAMLALCMNSPNFESIEETFDNTTMTAYCHVKRKGMSNLVEGKFSQEDAKKANLWGKAGPWTNYPLRMLQLRARGFALRDAFADALKGLISAEEAQDYPVQDNRKERAKDVIGEIIAKKETPRQIEYINEADAEALYSKITEAKADIIALCQHYKIDNLEMLPKSSLPKVFEQLNKKIAKTKQDAELQKQAENSDITAEEFFEGVE